MYFGYLVILAFLSVCNGTGLLKFAKSRSPSHAINYVDLKKRTILDASAQFHRYLYLVYDERSQYNIAFEFQCHQTSNKEPLEEVELCCNDPDKQSRSCESVIQRKDITCGKLNFNVNYDPKKGPTFELPRMKIAWKEARNSLMGTISCRISRNGTSLESNEIEVHDSLVYKSSERLQVIVDRDRHVKIPPIRNVDIPVAFLCLPPSEHQKIRTWPNWMLQKRHMPIQYHYCEIDSKSSIINGHSCYENKLQLQPNQHLVDNDGILYITDINFFNTGNRVIVCTTNENAVVNTFVGEDSESDNLAGLKALPGQATTFAPVESLVLNAISPLNNDLTFVGSYPKEGFFLKALYRPSIGYSKAVWYKNGIEQAGQAEFQYKFDKSMVLQPGGITGTYLCQVSLTNSQSSIPQQPLQFKYNLTVVEPPIFVDPDCLKLSTFVMQGQDYARKCSLQPNTMPSKVLLGVNGQLSDGTKSLRVMLGRHYGHLKDLQVEFSRDRSQPNLYYVNVQRLKPLENFRFSMEASNEFGKSLINGYVKVIPKPKLQEKPQLVTDCKRPDCMSPITIKALLDPAYERMLASNFKMRTKVDWVINGLSTEFYDPESEIFRFVDFDPRNLHEITVRRLAQKQQPSADGKTSTTTSSTTMQQEQAAEEEEEEPEQQEAAPADEQPVERETNDQERRLRRRSVQQDSAPSKSRGVGAAKDDTLFEYLKRKATGGKVWLDVKLRVRIYMNKTVMSQETEVVRQQGVAEENLVYDSALDHDAQFLDGMTAAYLVGKLDEQPNTASMTIVLVCVFAVVMLLIAILLLVYFVKRPKSENYLVAKSEKKKGYDHERELTLETNKFQHLQITAKPNEMNQLLADQQMGSEDDGELEAYQNESYDESASFVEQYATPYREDCSLSPLFPLPGHPTVPNSTPNRTGASPQYQYSANSPNRAFFPSPSPRHHHIHNSNAYEPLQRFPPNFRVYQPPNSTENGDYETGPALTTMPRLLLTPRSYDQQAAPPAPPTRISTVMKSANQNSRLSTLV